jgi:malate dehydrogenase (oxaloacetate-decarboxylating)
MKTNASNSIILRLKLNNHPGVLATAMSAIGDAGGDIGAVDIVRFEDGCVIRDITVDTENEAHAKIISQCLENLPNIEILHISDRTFLFHLGGKIEIKSKNPIKNRDDLSMAYTPGVARVCMAIHDEPDNVFKLTCKRNMVAVVTDGTAVLGLGDIGPEAAMPVMEGKAMLFKDLAGVDAFPICLATKDVEEIIQTVKAISPSFGGINLEDIAAPRCFEIEERLKKELNIPVFHDDQHGTAVVFAAGFINALKLTGKKAETLKVVLSGVGAAGMACTLMLKNLGVKNIIGCDRKGALHNGRTDLDSSKQYYASLTNPHQETGSLKDVIKGADVFVGLSAPNMLDATDIQHMNKDPIVFAMANPEPEIMPEIAAPYVAVMATGRSDYPNQINNVLAFPGIFRGALDCYATEINDAMKLAAAHAIANVIQEDQLSADYIIPSVFDTSVAPAVAEAVKKAAQETGVAKK